MSGRDQGPILRPEWPHPLPPNLHRDITGRLSNQIRFLSAPPCLPRDPLSDSGQSGGENRVAAKNSETAKRPAAIAPSLATFLASGVLKIPGHSNFVVGEEALVNPRAPTVL